MIYKNKHGELWCECGNRVDAEGFYPVDAEGNRVAHITSDQNVVYQCDRCQACIHLNKVEPREYREVVVKKSVTTATLEVRQAAEVLTAMCGHRIERTGFFVFEAGDGFIFCGRCGQMRLKGLLLWPPYTG